MTPSGTGHDRSGETDRPFRVVNPEGAAAIVICCDHASNAMPPEFENLGLSAGDLARHIAWDIGAADVAIHLSYRFGAPAVLCGTSRLVIDCNRHPEDPAAVPEVSDGTPIPGNRNLSAADRAERTARFFAPYQAAVAAAVEAKLAAGLAPILLSVHSMTPEMGGKLRPWQIALSSREDRRLTDPVLAKLKARGDIVVGDNEPYGLDPAEDYTTPVHAFRHRLPHLQVEFRQDEVATGPGAARWAGIFGEAVAAALKEIGPP